MTSLSSTITSFVRKSAPIVALYCDVNFLLTYWFINDVFPTLTGERERKREREREGGRERERERERERGGGGVGRVEGVLHTAKYKL